MSKTVHRERWNADRARRKAAALADFPDDAAALTFEADLAEQHADLCERYDTARSEFLATREAGEVAWAQALLKWAPSDGPRPVLADFLPGRDAEVTVAYKALGAELHELRKFWRTLGEENGTRAAASVRNHVTDPTVDELAAWAAERKEG